MTRLAINLWTALVLVGCASDPSPVTSLDAGDAASVDAGACPMDLPKSCPPVAPSYSADVAPLLQRRCTMCHSPGGAASNRDFTTYAGVSANKSPILNQVYGCLMPPSDAAPPTSDERHALLGWLVCHAPNN